MEQDRFNVTGQYGLTDKNCFTRCC